MMEQYSNTEVVKLTIPKGSRLKLRVQSDTKGITLDGVFYPADNQGIILMPEGIDRFEYAIDKTSIFY